MTPGYGLSRFWGFITNTAIDCLNITALTGLGDARV
jgi:hypothetical protein